MDKPLIKIQGTPIECGAQVWEKLCLPAVRAASHRPQMEMGQFYAGIISAAFGAMSADLGHEGAMHMLRTLTDSFARMADEIPGGLTQ